ncbi:MAG: molybdenum cofactor biosynthesis protein MoaE [Spirochaetales bacterium]
MSSSYTIGPAKHLRQGAVPRERLAEVTATFEQNHSVGAVVSFCGVVRADELPDAPPGSRVEAIEFSAHEEMAERATRELCERLATGVESEAVLIHVEHALGRVLVGEYPIVIVVGTGHRAEAFSLCSGILEALKSEVPIYGRELLDSGGSAWKKNT